MPHFTILKYLPRYIRVLYNLRLDLGNKIQTGVSRILSFLFFLFVCVWT